MDRTVREAEPAGVVEAESNEEQAEPLDLTVEQIEERVSAQTSVLMGILEREGSSHWHHGGINE
jgi:hypothetical protein